MDPLLPPASDAGRRPPAPGRLELLRTFMNTVDLESGEDDFSSPAALAEWLTTRGFLAPDTGLGETDRQSAIGFREAVRELLEANAGHGSAREAGARLDRIATRVPLRVRVGISPGLEPEDASGIDAAIGRFLAIIYEAVTMGTWQHLKVCRNDTCRWAFCDSSRNHSGAWCTMAICGNRMKGRAFRRRHPAGAATG